MNLSDGQVTTFANQRGGSHARIAFSPDGERLAMVTATNSVFIYRVSDGSLENILQVSNNNSLYDVEFSHDNQQLAAVGSGIIALWRVADWNLERVISDGLNRFDLIEFAPDSQHIAVSGLGFSAFTRVYTRTLSLRWQRTNAVYPHFSPDGSLIACTTWPRSGYVQDIVLFNDNGEEVRRLTPENDWGISSPNRFVVIEHTFLSSGDLMAFVGNGYTPETGHIIKGDISLFRRNAQWQRVPLFRGHTGRVTDVAISPDGSLIASAGRDGIICIWNASDGSVVSILPSFQSQDYWATTWQVRRVAFSPLAGGLSYLLAAAYAPFSTYEGAVRVWRWSDQQLVHEFASSSRQLSVRFSPDGQLLASCGYGVGSSSVWLWRTDNWTLGGQITGGIGNPFDVCFTPDNNFIVVADWNQGGNLYMYSVRTGRKVRTLQGYLNGATNIAIASSDGCQPQLTIASGEGAIRWKEEEHPVFANLWQVPANAPSTLPPTRRYGPLSRGEAVRVAFTGDGLTLVTGDWSSIRFWQVLGGSLRLRYDEETLSVIGLVFSPNNRYFVYGRDDGSIVLARNPFWLEGDANGNGRVDLTDIAQVVGDMETQFLRSDINGDGAVDWSDLDMVIENLGASNCEEDEGCNVQIEENPGYLWDGDQFTFHARASEGDGTYQWQVIQSNGQLSPTSGTGSTFTVTAQRPSRDRNDRVRIIVTYTLQRDNRTIQCHSVRELIVYPRPREAYVIYRNESDPSNAYPFENQDLAIWAVIRASDGEYYTGLRYDPENRGVWFSNDGRWLRTGIIYNSDGGGGEGLHFEPTGVAFTIDRRVREWWGPELTVRWYELRHEVDVETRFSQASSSRRRYFYIYPAYAQPAFGDNGSGWGFRPVRLSMGTHRFQVRVSWQDRQGRTQRIQSSGPTPGAWQPSDQDDIINWNHTWSQNCDEQQELATRISVRQVRSDIQTERKRRLVEWATSFLEVPYEWGGYWYGGRADVRAEWHTPYNGYGVDCSGFVCAVARWAGYNWGSRRGTYWRVNVSGMMDENYTRAQTIARMEPGDILAAPGRHVEIVYQILERWYDRDRRRWEAQIYTIDACVRRGGNKVHIHQNEQSYGLRDDGRDGVDIWRVFLNRRYRLRELVEMTPDG